MGYAGWGARVGAYLIDGLVIAPFTGLAMALDRPAVDATTGEMTGGGAIYWGLSLLGLVVTGYNRWFQQGSTGQSWGKKALGITLHAEATGQPIGAGKAFLRDLAHIVDALPCYLGFLWPLWDQKKQTLSDKVMGTVVVRV